MKTRYPKPRPHPARWIVYFAQGLLAIATLALVWITILLAWAVFVPQ